ncbi:DUF2059 domain-containing protein [Duganella sp. BJB476]|uniref:DUF2059 domain-containing protein n=1 Tax=Duganella sp. BJB476 TaxID=1871176 RepID=UPI001314DAC9|nr:DUF2059 domain-containing protein [Duganella sp. BJB476]
MKKFMFENLFFIVCMVMPLFVFAESTTSTTKQGAQLGKLLDYQSVPTSFKDQCELSQAAALDPKSIFKVQPDAFGGITPESKYWPRVVAAYKKYQVEICRQSNIDGVNDIVAKEMANSLSQKELRAAIAFFSSPEGQAFKKANIRSWEAISQQVTKANATPFESLAYKKVNKEISDIVGEFQRNRR